MSQKPNWSAGAETVVVVKDGRKVEASILNARELVATQGYKFALDADKETAEKAVDIEPEEGVELSAGALSQAQVRARLDQKDEADVKDTKPKAEPKSIDPGSAPKKPISELAGDKTEEQYLDTFTVAQLREFSQKRYKEAPALNVSKDQVIGFMLDKDDAKF